ncbi:hypothetical protein [Deinococcus sp. QL22]|uniref:hypothetical protein n=1 Tax=Deinococcus sp. QL22 TaxID=2939437 RepID=UPI002017328B|nr:hypothetical protein [Deinococcus sp. QL22]UQN06538.1 hypothetical protein M1R55_01050 [Deinococcus sp. QL22]
MRRRVLAGSVALTLAAAGWAGAGGFLLTTSDLSTYCLREQCRLAGHETRAMFGNVLLFQVYTTRRPGILWVGRYRDGQIIESRLEFKHGNFQSTEWTAMQRFVQDATGTTVPVSKFQTCMKALTAQQRDPGKQGYGRWGVQVVQNISVECEARPLGTGKGAAFSVSVHPDGE